MDIGNSFIGNARAVENLNKIIKIGKFSHVYLFDGPESVGKTRLALEFSAFLLGDTLEKVFKNPDLIFISPDDEKKVITSDKVREMQKSLSMYPYNSDYKIAIIDKAHLMNRTSSNSLLKILEEPSETSMMILISSNTENILDTIISRCQVIKFGLSSEEDMKKNIVSKNEFFEDIMDLALGRPGIALDFLEDKDKLKNVLEARQNFINLKNSNSFEKIKEAGRISGMEKKEIDLFLDSFLVYFRKMLRGSISKKSDDLEAVKKTIELINKTKFDICNSNVNLKLSLENLYLNY